MKNSILKNIHQRATRAGKTIVLPESDDVRVLKAAIYLVEEGICEVILVGSRGRIEKKIREENRNMPGGIHCLSLDTVSYRNELVDHLYRRRRHKGLSREEAAELLKNPLYLGAGLVALDKADGCVAGSVATTGEIIRTAIHSIGLREGREIVSSTFLMALEDGRVVTYADCGVVPYPNSEQLADIAIASARTHRLLTKKEPDVALLSFSTKGSASHGKTQLVIDALTLVKNRAPGLNVDGELQFDAAFIPEVAQRKAPDSTVAGHANVFIFPNLDAGNIAYKITERLAGASATGPILQGLAKPMMDLSRGCSWRDIVNAACVSILMGKGEEP